MTEILSSVPEKITAGDYVQWQVDNSDYPAATYALTYALVKSGAKIAIVAAASGNTHLVSLAAATTAAYAAGKYRWQAYMTAGDARYMVDSGEIEILPNFAAQSTGYDARSDAQQIYEACEAIILNRATKGQNETLVAGERLMLMPIQRLLELRDKYLAVWKKEQRSDARKAGRAKSNAIYVRFEND